MISTAINTTLFLFAFTIFILMKNITVICALLLTACTVIKNNKQNIPALFIGNFTDDYGIKYNVSDSMFTQLKGIEYRILQWNIKEQYIIAQNGANNPTDKNLYTRIDYMQFTNMQPYTWGFCYTQYKAVSKQAAINTAAADRSNPKTGCNGYPFSRLKRIE